MGPADGVDGERRIELLDRVRFPGVAEAGAVTAAVRAQVQETRAVVSKATRRDKTFQEALNMAFPAAKASFLLLTGSLRSFQTLVKGLSDDGKEEEDSLHLLPLGPQAPERGRDDALLHSHPVRPPAELVLAEDLQQPVIH